VDFNGPLFLLKRSRITLMSAPEVTIVIPARYGSTRLPGKPLHILAGKPMLAWVIQAAQDIPNTNLLVATDHPAIVALATSLNVAAILTPSDCSSGTDRVYNALTQLTNKPRYVINLQGDAPLTNKSLLQQLIFELTASTAALPVVTPAINLTWEQYDKLAVNKLSNPYSGTLCIKSLDDHALWFSKQIIPQVRNEIYGYSFAALEKFISLPVSFYEQLEGLEQLRFMENNIPIKLIMLADNINLWRGVDTVDDAQFVASLLEQKE
jgi:3-deoxy-manno-octulosonate cytidylyltransferase (CMP-KDO synthetase)